jgi:hypothetical protein
MITNESLTRTFRIKYGKFVATCFTLDFEGRQYLITAGHLLESFPPGGVVEIMRNNIWHPVPCTLIGRNYLKHTSLDVAVLATPHPIWSPHPCEPSTKDIVLGQDVYFLGFPYEMSMPSGQANGFFPLPLVKKACVSMFDFSSPTGPWHLMLDGHNNPGFSGGPVLFAPKGYGSANKIAGIISSYRNHPNPVLVNNLPSSGIVLENSGIINVCSIDHAIQIIKARPIGPLLPGASKSA